MDKNKKIQEVVENGNSQIAGRLIVELLLGADEDIAEIAVPFPCKMPVMLVVKVIAGVVEALATVPANPFAEATETVVTVPPVEGFVHDGLAPGPPVVKT